MEIDPRYPSVTKKQREALLEVKRDLEAEAPEGRRGGSLRGRGEAPATHGDNTPRAGATASD